MVTINYLYEIELSCSNTLPTIDETTTVTVTVNDFNNTPLPNIALTISVDKGYFTKYTKDNADTNINGTNTKSYNGVTGSDGTFTMTCKTSEWGLCTISCDTKKIQYYVTGFKTLSVTSAQGNSCTFKVDESQRACWLQWTMPSTSLTGSAKTIDTITLPDEKYKANYPVYTEDFRSDTSIYLQINGTILARLYSGTSNHGSSVITFFWTYGAYD